MLALEDRGISVRQGTHAVHTLGYYKNKYGLRYQDCFASYIADRLSLTLPLYADMTDQEFNYIIMNLRKILQCAV